MKTNLYRHFDKNGDLLYVGVSLSALTRLAQHREHSHWFEEISNVAIEIYDTREAALAAETDAIYKERPRYNIRKQIRDSKERYKITRYEAARKSIEDLIDRTVNYEAIYEDKKIAQILFVSLKQVKEFIESGKLGGIKIYESARRVKNGKEILLRKYVVSGWQLIDFIEMCQKTGEFPFVTKKGKNT